MIFFRKIASLFRRTGIDAEMAEEMRLHLEQRTREGIAAGLSLREARQAARRQFGGVDQVKEIARDQRTFPWVNHVRQDLGYAWRMLRKSPGFTFVAVATLAIGIGANTAIFSAVDAVLLRPLPYPDAHKIVRVFETVPSGQANSVSGGAFLDWHRHQTQFEALALTANDRFDLTGRGAPEKINALSITSDFAQVFQLPPLRGRHFSPADDQVGGQNHVVMLSESFWRTRFGGTDDAVGQTLVIDGNDHEIIGVMPADISDQRSIQVFLPFVLRPNTYLTSFNVHRAKSVGRLKPDATLASAVAELNAIKRNVQDTYPEWMHGWGVGARPLQSMLGESTRPFLLMLLGATTLVLLISCANVANLLLARAAVRHREIALRAALGASSGRIVRQVLTESVLLALLGGVGGVLLAVLSIRLMRTLTDDFLPSTMGPELDPRVLGFGLLVSMATGLAFGVFPALRARRPDLNHALKNGNTGSTDGGRTRSQSGLVIAEIALTAVLLIGTGLLVRGMIRTVTAALGFNPENVLMFVLTPPYNGAYSSPAQRIAFLEQSRAELEAVPGVVAVAGADDLPFGNDGQGYFYSLEEEPETRQDRAGQIKYVSENYFSTLGATLLRGRPITAQDNRPDAPDVMIINETMARQLFAADEDPIGRRIHVDRRAWEVIGVVANIRIDVLHTPPPPTFFVPQVEFVWASGFMVRTQGDPSALAPSVTAAVHRIDPNLPLVDMQTLIHAMSTALGPRRAMLNLISAFAAVALLLAAIGLYGVMAFAVANRRRELSIRMALGAARRDIMQLILRHGARLLLVGLGGGLITAFVIARTVGSQWAAVSANDPVVFGAAAVVLGLVTLMACWLPARQAARADPVATLRAE